jgi:site-specific DNA-methyltransferase (adenine-specific)
MPPRPKPYYSNDQVELYLGRMEEVVPALNLKADLLCVDPPYAETSLPWDRWPDGWPTIAATVANSMWCFGSMRMWLRRHAEVEAAGWKLSQDVVWYKNTGSGRAADRFRRVHEHALHWYRGQWREVHHEAVRIPAPPTWSGREIRLGAVVHKRAHVQHTGHYEASQWVDDGTRLMTSVIPAKNGRGLAHHPTQKPTGLLVPMIEYGCPPGGVVVDFFAGSGSTLEAVQFTNLTIEAGRPHRRAIGIEVNEEYAERAALRLSQAPLGLA